MPKLDVPDTPRQVTYNLGEHEVLLSFVNDADAVAFDAWWQQDGLKRFKKWFEIHGADYE